MKHLNPVLQPWFLSVGSGMANFFQKNKREFRRKLIVVFVKYLDKRHTAISVNVVGSKHKAKRQDRKLTWDF